MAERMSSVSTMSAHTERLLGFSDAVFAIAMTFLALDLGEVPETVGETLSAGDYIAENVRNYGVYFGTFLIVGLLWWRHHLIFRYIKRTSGAVQWLNIALLALTALLPYPAAVVSEAPGLSLALVMLLVPLTLVSIITWVMFEVAYRSGLTIPEIPKPTVGYLRSQLAAPATVLLLATILAALGWQLDSSLFRDGAISLWVLLILLPLLLRLKWPTPNRAVDISEDKLGPEWDSLEETEAEQASRVRSTLERIRNGSDSDRLKVLTDGVVAIAVTILALQLTPPAPDDAQTNEELLENLFSVPWWTYLSTFFLICLFWGGHVRIFRAVIGVNSILLWLNLFFLMFVSFLPTTAALMSHDDAIPAVQLYLATFFGVAASMAAMSTYSAYSKRLMIIIGLPYQQKVRTFRSVMLVSSFLIALIIVTVTQDGWWSNLVWILLIFTGRISSSLDRLWAAKYREEQAANQKVSS